MIMQRNTPEWYARNEPTMTDKQFRDIRTKLAESDKARQVRTYNEAGEMIKDWHDDKR